MKALILITLFISSCASQKAHYDKLKMTYGYTDEDIELMQPHRARYTDMMAGTFAQSNEYDNSRFTRSKNRLQKVFCNCSKKLGGKCIRSSKGLKKDQLTIWAKGNAAFQVHKSMGNNMWLGTSGDLEFDDDEC
ncbi:MAG: hypothetical protein HON90_05850 [Halobacteriovoraceae bacterium]|jgi:hypothetical protein|nr:hypothetical protein [Halobacteriovoraceae bacterium]